MHQSDVSWMINIEESLKMATYVFFDQGKIGHSTKKVGFSPFCSLSFTALKPIQPPNDYTLREAKYRILDQHSSQPKLEMTSNSTKSNRTVYDRETTTKKVIVEPDAIEWQPRQKGSAASSPSPERQNASNTPTDVENAASASNKANTLDPNLVDWDGPDDPANPRNWSKAFKMANIFLVSLSVLYCNLATTMFSPGAKLMQREFGFKSDAIEILTITIASLGFAAGQFFVPPLSEVFGRVPVYRVSSILYLGFTAGCARSTHVAEFLVFRLLTGLAAASYMSTGGGTVADLLPQEERGIAMALFTAGPLLGPVSTALNNYFETRCVWGD